MAAYRETLDNLCTQFGDMVVVFDDGSSMMLYDMVTNWAEGEDPDVVLVPTKTESEECIEVYEARPRKDDDRATGRRQMPLAPVTPVEEGDKDAEDSAQRSLKHGKLLCKLYQVKE